MLFSTSVAVNVYKRYNVNYAFIFEIDPHAKLLHHQLYKITLLFTFIWSFCLVGQIALVKLQTVFETDYAIFTLLLPISFIVLCFLPFKVIYRGARFQLLKTLISCLGTPFTTVRFRHFFLADVSTSIIPPIQNTTAIYCYFASHDWKSGTAVDLKGQCLVAFKIHTFLSFVPFWLRFGQCLNKWNVDRIYEHLFNAFKYFCDLVVQFAAIFIISNTEEDPLMKNEVNRAFWAYVGLKFWTESYSYAWDLYIDWGLLRQNTPGHPHRFLRDKIIYSPKFYYWCIFSDGVLRYFWTVSLFAACNGAKGT